MPAPRPQQQDEFGAMLRDLAQLLVGTSGRRAIAGALRDPTAALRSLDPDLTAARDLDTAGMPPAVAGRAKQNAARRTLEALTPWISPTVSAIENVTRPTGSTISGPMLAMALLPGAGHGLAKASKLARRLEGGEKAVASAARKARPRTLLDEIEEREAFEANMRGAMLGTPVSAAIGATPGLVGQYNGVPGSDTATIVGGALGGVYGGMSAFGKRPGAMAANALRRGATHARDWYRNTEIGHRGYIRSEVARQDRLAKLGRTGDRRADMAAEKEAVRLRGLRPGFDALSQRFDAIPNPRIEQGRRTLADLDRRIAENEGVAASARRALKPGEDRAKSDSQQAVEAAYGNRFARERAEPVRHEMNVWNQLAELEAFDEWHAAPVEMKARIIAAATGRRDYVDVLRKLSGGRAAATRPYMDEAGALVKPSDGTNRNYPRPEDPHTVGPKSLPKAKKKPTARD